MQTVAQHFERDDLASAAPDPRQMVGGDAPNPRRDGALPAKRAQVRDDDEEDFLCRVLRVSRVSQHAQGQLVDIILDLLEKPLRSGLVAGGRRTPELCEVLVRHPAVHALFGERGTAFCDRSRRPRALAMLTVARRDPVTRNAELPVRWYIGRSWLPVSPSS